MPTTGSATAMQAKRAIDGLTGPEERMAGITPEQRAKLRATMQSVVLPATTGEETMMTRGGLSSRYAQTACIALNTVTPLLDALDAADAALTEAEAALHHEQTRVAAVESARDVALARAEAAEEGLGGWTGRKCSDCHGTGETNEARSCASCGGTGGEWATWRERADRAEARVKELEAALRIAEAPPGTYDRQTVREAARSALRSTP